MIDLRNLVQRSTRAQRFMFVAGVLWFIVKVPSGLATIGKDYKERHELAEQMLLPACAVFAEAPIADFKGKYGAIMFRGEKAEYPAECTHLVIRKSLAAEKMFSEQEFGEQLARSQGAFKEALVGGLDLVFRFLLPLAALYGLIRTIGWILRGRRGTTN